MEEPVPLPGEPIDANCRVYDPPVDDFTVESIELFSLHETYTLWPRRDFASIVLTLQGHGVVDSSKPLSLHRGIAFVQAAGEKITLTNRANATLWLLRAYKDES